MSKPSISPGRQFVVGFMFDSIMPTEAYVLLTQKTRPKWQAGKLNGIGGELKPGESINQAMTREFKEETGIRFDEWVYFCKMRYIEQETIHFFYAFHPILHDCRKQTDEELVALHVKNVCADLIRPGVNASYVSDLRWLIPMAWQMDKENCEYIEVIKCGVIVPNG